MKTAHLFPLTLATTLLATSTVLAQNGWVNLFNGKNLDGWEEHSGKAQYSVEDGVLTGESVAGSGNSFLCTRKKYGNFELELEYKCDPLLNSGVQVRSEVFPEATTAMIGGKEFKFAPDRIHGYQCEIDMDAARGRMWSAGIYDEARRGWLFPADGEKGPQGLAFSAQGRAVSKNGEWNKLRIVANGPMIKTWLNGVPRAEIYDNVTPRGVIALQVHGVGNDAKKVGLKVQFRHIRIHELAPNTLTAQEKAEGWKLLWNGKTTAGWRSPESNQFPKKSWLIHDGELTVDAGVTNGDAESQAGGDIITRKRYSNFEFAADFKTTYGCNSGIKIFVQPNISPIDKVTGKPTAKGSAIGLEFQILDDAHHPDAKRGRNGDRTIGSLYDLIPAAKDKKVMPLGEWNHAYILSRGKHVEFWLNGVKTLEFDRGSEAFRQAVAESKFKDIPNFGEWADGHILLQEHGSQVSFRNVKIHVLPAN
jgi:3-keto-disaccharide hydrolase